MRYRSTIGKKSGVTIIEFTLVILVALLLIFTAFEFSRYVLSMQMLNEMTRKAARLAVVCSIESRDDILTLPEVVENSPTDFNSSYLLINYLDRDGVEVNVDGFTSEPDEDDKDEMNQIFSTIRFVTAEIDTENFKFQFVPLLSFFGEAGAVEVPSFKTILPIESLGIIRNNDGSPSGAIEHCGGV